jgi:hypothetical protein
MSKPIDTAKLLRLKRYEKPPEGYFDDFMRDLHRRQRADVVQRPTREVLWDRLLSLAPTFHVPRLAYAAIAAMAISASLLIVGQRSTDAPALASTEAAATSTTFSLTSQKPVTISEALPASSRTGESLPSHYVLQKRPVSNEQPLSF